MSETACCNDYENFMRHVAKCKSICYNKNILCMDNCFTKEDTI